MINIDEVSLRWWTGHLKAKITARNGSPIFEGNIYQFGNCFFNNAGLGQVIIWAERNDFILKLGDHHE